MTMRRHCYIAALMLAAIATACQGNGNRDIPVPRRTAYQRMQLPPATYRPVTLGSVTLNLNASADTTGTAHSGSNEWLTAQYPGGLAQLYITVSQATPTNIDEMIDNRVERLSLNTGGAETQVSSFTTPGGMDARIVVTPHDSPTPVQFIATDHATTLVSGSAHVRDAATAPADSLAPVIEMLTRDITHLVTTLTAP